MPWAFTGGPVDVGHGRYGRLDTGNGAEVPGRAQKRVDRNTPPLGRYTIVWGTGTPKDRDEVNRREV